MLYDVLFIVLMLYIMAVPLMVVKSIMIGVKLAEKPQETAETPIFNIPKPKKKPKLSKADQRSLDILANIEAYCGDSTGQKEIR